MKTYFASLSFSMVGCTQEVLVSARTETEAWDEALRLSLELAESFGFEQNEDHFGDLDSVGLDWNEEEVRYEQEGFLDPGVELYDDKKHELSIW